MNLLIDAGNTRIKWAWVAPDAAPAAWRASGRVDHGDATQFAQLVAQWSQLNAEFILVSNVAGAALHERIAGALRQAPGLREAAIEWFASVDARAGVSNGYRNPGQLGCDRFASAIGAHALHPKQTLLVATCGTATTIDAIDADGRFLGGLILPGLGLMAQSLARNTAQLPQVAAGLSVTDPFADHTDAAIASGCLAAQAGAIEHACAALEGRQARAPLCLLSGGAAELIAPHVSVPHIRIDNLVLIGLQVAARFPTSAPSAPC